MGGGGLGKKDRCLGKDRGGPWQRQRGGWAKIEGGLGKEGGVWAKIEGVSC